MNENGSNSVTAVVFESWLGFVTRIPLGACVYIFIDLGSAVSKFIGIGLHKQNRFGSFCTLIGNSGDADDCACIVEARTRDIRQSDDQVRVGESRHENQGLARSQRNACGTSFRCCLADSLLLVSVAPPPVHLNKLRNWTQNSQDRRRRRCKFAVVLARLIGWEWRRHLVNSRRNPRRNERLALSPRGYRSYKGKATPRRNKPRGTRTRGPLMTYSMLSKR